MGGVPRHDRRVVGSLLRAPQEMDAISVEAELTVPIGRHEVKVHPVRQALRVLRVLAKQAMGVEPLVRTVGRRSLEFHGNAAGGWCILAGSLGPEAVVVDIGLGEDASFSESIISKYGCIVNAFDPTPRAIEYVNGLRNDHLRFYEYGIGATAGTAEFYLPKETAHVSGAIAREEHLGPHCVEVQLRTIGQIFGIIGASRLDLLKLDVEGAEYDVIASEEFHQYALAIDQICVEFHHRWKSRGRDCTVAAVKTLGALGFECAWRSRSTNEEFLFVKRGIP
jgi:FkbM family methyltransferase